MRDQNMNTITIQVVGKKKYPARAVMQICACPLFPEMQGKKSQSVVKCDFTKSY